MVCSEDNLRLTGVVTWLGFAVHLVYDPPLALADSALEAYRAALMNANQGNLEARVVPTRAPRRGGV